MSDFIQFANAWIPAQCIQMVTVDKQHHWFSTSHRVTAWYKPECQTAVIGRYTEFAKLVDALAAAERVASAKK